VLKSLPARVVLGLFLGLAVGILLHLYGPQALHAAYPAIANGAHLIEALGDLWLNALQMTVVPLVFSLLITGIASVTDAAATGRLAARAVVLFVVLILCASAYGIVATNSALMLWPVAPGEINAVLGHAQAAADSTTTPAPDFAEWIKALAPTNVIKAAAEPNILQLVIFAVFFGFAATRLAPNLREPLVAFFNAIAETMVVIVRWVLLAGPIGVFALSLGVGLNAGIDALGALAHYIAIVAGVTALATPIAFALALLSGRQRAGAFARAATPVWAIAFSTQSSLASLPAMVETARGPLGIPARVVDLVLPLAVAVFRFTSPIANLAVCIFIAHLYNLHPSALQMTGAVFVAFAMSVGSVGLPGQVSYIAAIAPICLSLGLPTNLLGIFLAVEVVPDIFRTLGNVTGDLAAATILHQEEKGEKFELSADANIGA